LNIRFFSLFFLSVGFVFGVRDGGWRFLRRDNLDCLPFGTICQKGPGGRIRRIRAERRITGDKPRGL